MATAADYAREYARRKNQPTYKAPPARPRATTPPVPRPGEIDRTSGVSYTPTTSENEMYRAATEDIADRAAYRQWLNQPTMPTQPAGGGGGGGYGGGGGGTGKADALRQMSFLMELLKSGQFNPQERGYTRDQAMYDRVAKGVSADRANADTAYDQLDQYLAGMGPNAYAQMADAQGPQADMSMLNLIAAQGGDTAAATAQANFLAQTGQGTADAYNRMVDNLAAAEVQNRQSRGSEAAQARAFTDRELAAQALGLNTALDFREQNRRQSIEDQNFQLQQQAQQAKLQLFMQLSQIATQFGLPQPTMEQLGITAPTPVKKAATGVPPIPKV